MRGERKVFDALMGCLGGESFRCGLAFWTGGYRGGGNVMLRLHARFRKEQTEDQIEPDSIAEESPPPSTRHPPLSSVYHPLLPHSIPPQP